MFHHWFEKISDSEMKPVRCQRQWAAAAENPNVAAFDFTTTQDSANTPTHFSPFEVGRFSLWGQKNKNKNNRCTILVIVKPCVWVLQKCLTLNRNHHHLITMCFKECLLLLLRITLLWLSPLWTLWQHPPHKVQWAVTKMDKPEKLRALAWVYVLLKSIS